MAAYRLTNLSRLLKPKNSFNTTAKCLQSNQTAVELSEYTEKPEYPEIKDLSREGLKKQKLQALEDHFKSLPTVEEKLRELNMSKYYGWWTLHMKEESIPYNCLPFVQHATRTCLVESLPPQLSSQEFEAKAASCVGTIKPKLEEIIVTEFEGLEQRTGSFDRVYSSAFEENRHARNCLPQVNRLLLNSLQEENEQLGSMVTDKGPRVDGFWFLGGVEPDKMLRNMRKGVKMPEERIDEPIDRPLQYLGEPCLTVRHTVPLPQLLDRESGLSLDGSIPEFTTDPRTLGYKYKHRFGTNVPGFWPGTEAQFGYLSMLLRGHMQVRDRDLENRDHQEGLHAQAVLHSFSWLLSQACYLGFGPYTELEYPLTTQTIISNGQYFSFYAYQLNTCALHGPNSSGSNPHRNVCFGTPEMKLFDTVENGSVKGFNDDVLKTLIKFYLTQPVARDVEMRPYLGTPRYAANIEDPKKRDQIEQEFKFMYSNRPRSMLKPEIYHWEKIYKIDHDTRGLERKRRFFELGKLGQYPGNRRFDDYNPPYVPKALREVPKRSRRYRIPNVPKLKL